MKNRNDLNILYPENTVVKKKLNPNPTILPHFHHVPCASYENCGEELDRIFYEIGNCQPDNIFVFGRLRQGKIDFDDSYILYTDEDCPVEDSVVEKDDEVCSEEYCAQILLPYCDVYFPNARVNQFLANDFGPFPEEFINKLKSQYPSSLFLFSEFNPFDR